MHKSRLGTVVIDCEPEDIDTSAAFWSAALGWKTEDESDVEDPNYRLLLGPPDQVKLLVQKVTHPSRVHIDIETDDLEAEARRLEKLGARRVAFVKRWWVMEAPTGQRFCIVNPQRPDFTQKANVWSDEG